MLKDFIAFLREYGIVGLAIAVIIGVRVNDLVNSVVSDLVMPIILQPAIRAAGVDDIRELSAGGILYGRVLGSFLEFLVVAILVFVFAKLVLREEKVAKK
jgi:large conductance mechanosensitive channel